MTFYLWKMIVPSKSKKQKLRRKKIVFSCHLWRSLTKIAGSGVGSESVRQRKWSAEPDEYQNVIGSATLVYNKRKERNLEKFRGEGIMVLLGIVQVVQATASLARLADSAGESSSPSTDSSSSSDEDSEYEIEDIYQVPLLLIFSSVQFNMFGPFTKFHWPGKVLCRSCLSFWRQS